MVIFSLALATILMCGLQPPPWAAASVTTATVRYVSQDGTCGTNTPCYASVQAAVDAASDGDEVRVAAGVYAGVSARGGASQLAYITKTILLLGGYHPGTWVRDPSANESVLNAQKLGRVLVIAGGSAPVVDGFHIISGTGGNGGGIFVDGPAPTVRRNEVYGNWAEGHGGGIYLKSSAAAITENHIYTNTTSAPGRGGGLAIVESQATVLGNTLENNLAHIGGGIELNNTALSRGAILSGNVIRNNVAADWQENPPSGPVFDGSGGRIAVNSYLTIESLRDNLVIGNQAKRGGGLYAFGASVAIAGSEFRENQALYHGGGLYVDGGYEVTIEGCKVLSNTADSWGGGLYLFGDGAQQVSGNIFRGNVSGWRGGGMYASGSGQAQFDENLFLNNKATWDGGGLSLVRNVGAVYHNTVVVGNQAPASSGMYVWASDVYLAHTTIAANTGADGRAVLVDRYPGLADPTAPTLYTSTVNFRNSVVSDEPVGFFATPDNKLTVDGVLWWNTPVHIDAAGADLTVWYEIGGDPAFQPDGYHLRGSSAARDVVPSPLGHDLDGHLREPNGRSDMGADEYVPMVLVTPELTASLTYTDTREDVTITLEVPPGAISEAMGLMFSPFPPLPPDVLNSPFGSFVAVGPPFRLDPFKVVASTPVTDTTDPPLGVSEEPLIFGIPARVVAEIGLERAKEMKASMERLELQLLAILSAPSLPRVPACGPPEFGTEARRFVFPICDTGIITGTSAQAGGPPLRLLKAHEENQSGYFLFAIQVDQMKVFLPLVQRGTGN